MKRPRPQPSSEYLKLQAEWDERLRSSGFADAEDRRTGMLKTWSGSCNLVEDPPRSARKGRLSHTSSAKSKVDAGAYYRMASAFYHSHKFLTQLDQDVWHLHSGGTSNRKVAACLRVSVPKVRRIIRRLKVEMLGPPQRSAGPAYQARKQGGGK